MPELAHPEVIRFRSDMTLRWPCREGDLLLWFGYTDVFSGSRAIQCRELWEMRGGYHVTITNRLEDLPPWFQLHPTEISGPFVYRLLSRIQDGDYPREPIAGPNLWRLRPGDRLAWVGEDRPERRSVNGVLAILDCHESALAVGEGDKGDLEEFVGFGSPTTHEMKPGDVVRCQSALGIVQQLGLPRTWAPEWKLG